MTEFLRLFPIVAYLFASQTALAATADLQFFGDVFVPSRVVKMTESTAEDPRLFDQTKDLLASAAHNVFNLEGVVSTAFVTPELKRYLLRMPFTLPSILSAAGLDVATLANNHAMDFGFQGVFDTQVALHAAGIEYTGAGIDANDAARPVILVGPSGQTYCVLAFSRTLPATFWATDSRPGTAYADFEAVSKRISECAKSGLFTVATFHWGQELSSKVLPYQRILARKAIEAGARLVIGHHPHALQPVEIFRGRPIFYSLGNFAFGSAPDSDGQEGMAVRVASDAADRKIQNVEIIPLDVRNSRVHFHPTTLAEDQADPVAKLLPKKHPCVWSKVERFWSCKFTDP